jgi:hypothetical protein
MKRGASGPIGNLIGKGFVGSRGSLAMSEFHRYEYVKDPAKVPDAVAAHK